MENFTLQAITHELQETLSGQRLGRVYQSGATDLALDFRLRDSRWLMISTDPQRLALYLTRRDPRKPGAEARTDTPFASLLKKHLSGARLISIEKTGYDRVVRFDFEAFAADDNDEPEPIVPRSLVIELIGRAANVLLLEETKIIAPLRERTGAAAEYREPEPPARKNDPFDLTPDRLDELIAACAGDVASAARYHLIGFDQLYARELAARAETSTPAAALRQLLAELFGQPQPAIYSSAPLDEIRREPGRDASVTLTPISLKHLSDQIITRFATVNEAADACFTLLDERRSFLAARQQAQSALAARLKKQRALMNNLKREQAGYASAEQHQRYGELLLAGLHQAVKTERGFQVTDYYDAAQSLIEIPAADKADAKEAAEHYFRLARKARHGLQAISERLPPIECEVAELEAAQAELASITTLPKLTVFSERHLPAATVTRRKPHEAGAGRKAKQEQLSGVRRYRSSDGYEILVGRNSSDNDYLTFRVAKSYDLWFHAADYPGSHVVLRNPQRRELPPRAITEAAQLAARFSQARSDARVAVKYCERKFVTKPKGFAPGQVRLSSFKTVLVEPKEAGERVM
ncbi:MAG TPA: NFACT family protein [Blastocatellia bacterium]|nr:NFACT family protein [Blastocatellia bacterium]